MSNLLVAKEDKRNAAWRQNNIGSKLLQKMGWKDGEGIGKRQKGSAVAIRAVRQSADVTLGIGAAAEDDRNGHAGWSETTQNFSLVLEHLQHKYKDGDENEDEETKRKRRKLQKKIKKRKERQQREAAAAANSSNGETTTTSSAAAASTRSGTATKNKLVLAKNLVTAGHSKKMRESKDLSTKSAQDMAAIFGGMPLPVLSTISVGGSSATSKKGKSEKKSKKRKRKVTGDGGDTVEKDKTRDDGDGDGGPTETANATDDGKEPTEPEVSKKKDKKKSKKKDKKKSKKAKKE